MWALRSVVRQRFPGAVRSLWGYKMRPKRGATVLSIGLTFVAVHLTGRLATAQPPTSAPTDAEVVRVALERASELLLENQDATALRLLLQAERSKPDDPWLLFLLGEARRGLGQRWAALARYDDALRILKAGGTRDPTLTLELALARGAVLAELGDTAGARAALRQALDDWEQLRRAAEQSSDAQALAELWLTRGTIERELGNADQARDSLSRAQMIRAAMDVDDELLAEAIEREQRLTERQRVHFSAELGLAYDTNVTFTGDGVTTFDVSSGEDDGRFGSRFEFELTLLARENERLSVGTRLAHFWNFSVEQFNEQRYTGFARYTRNLSDRWRLDVGYEYDFTLLGNESFLSRHAAYLGLAYAWPRRQAVFEAETTSVAYRLQARDFRTSTMSEFDRDAFVNTIAVGQSFLVRVAPDWIWRVRTGYQFSGVRTEGEEFERNDHDFFFGLDIPLGDPLLPRQPLTFQFDVQWQIGNYRNNSLIDFRGRERSDLITAYSFVLSQILARDERYGDVILRAIINWTDADSNVEDRLEATPFTYEKLFYGLQLKWVW